MFRYIFPHALYNHISTFLCGPVDELPLVKAELKKSICRENALKVLVLFCSILKFLVLNISYYTKKKENG